MKNIILLLSLIPLLVLDLGCKSRTRQVDTRNYLEIQKDVMKTLLSLSTDPAIKNFDLNQDIKTWPGVYRKVNISGHITELYLNGQQLTGSIPADIEKLTSLTYLNLSENYYLTGSIPDDIGKLTSLRDLDLSSTKLTGSIPADIGNLTSLTSLILSRNQLTGSIPDDIGKLINLTNLYLSSNELTGSIPADIVNLTSLTNLYLSENKLRGPAPIIANCTVMFEPQNPNP